MLGSNNKEEIKKLREKISQKPTEIDAILREEAKSTTPSSRKRTKTPVKK